VTWTIVPISIWARRTVWLLLHPLIHSGRITSDRVTRRMANEVRERLLMVIVVSWVED
jgi:hypothetical protein